MGTHRTKLELLANIESEREYWKSLVAEVGTERMELPGPMGLWTFKDLAAHLLGWRRRTVARIVAAGQNQPTPENPWPAEFEDDDEINDWIYEQHRHRPLQDVLLDMDQSFVDAYNAINALPEPMLYDPTAFPTLGGVALADVNFAEHLHEEHVPSVRAWLKLLPVAGSDAPHE